MKFRSLLLGTAAVFAVGGGAGAADLTVVEAIDYVKVCDAYGAGYHYIPGTDTCLRIGGYVQLDAFFGDDIGRNLVGITADPFNPLPIDGSNGGVDQYPVHPQFDNYVADWKFTSEVKVNFTARTMSDLGPVVTYFQFVSPTGNEDSSNNVGFAKVVRLDNAYGSIGPLLFGYTNSTFDYGGGYTYEGSIFRSDKKVDLIRWSYALGSWGLMVGLEDPRDRYSFGQWKNATGDFPDIVLALTGSGGGWDWKLSGAVTDRTSGTGWAVQLGATVDLGSGFKLRGQGAYTDNAGSYAGLTNCAGLGANAFSINCGGDQGVIWSALVSGIVAISGNVNAAATFSYIDGDNIDAAWFGALGVYWAATSTSEIGAEVQVTDTDAADTDPLVSGRIRFKTYFGG
jgi:hypothetical protein